MSFFSFDRLHELWSVWEVRGIILFSLFLQSFLILVSPLRTKTANVVISVLLWLAYLLADAAATFAVSLISRSQGDTSSADKTTSYLLAFWAPILIIHLGGPDTITALALEDNELWKRHLLQLLSQLVATLYVLYKSMRDGELLAPTLLLLFVGLIKYGERVYSLYLASVNKFRESLLTEPDPGPNYAKLMEEYTMRIDARLPAEIEHIEEPEMEFVFSMDVPTEQERSRLQLVQDAYWWFTKFKGLVADLIYSKDDWRETRDYFSKRNAEQAFRIMEIELNFIYEALYTKMPAIRTWVGYILRLVCFVLLLVSFFLWHSMDKSHMRPHDVKITYALLGGAITLDVIAFFMLIFSDWPIANVIKGSLGPEDESQQKSTGRYKLKQLINKYLAISDRRWSDFSKKDRTILRKLLSQIFCFWRSNSAAQGDERTLPFMVMTSRIFYRRWSESVQQFNLIDYSVNVRFALLEKVYDWVGLTDFLDGVQYVSIRWFSESLRDSIFSELKDKSDTVTKVRDAHKICEARGEWVLENNLRSIIENFNWEVLKPWLTEVEYDESLILWHIATEICYNHDINEREAGGEDGKGEGEGEGEGAGGGGGEGEGEHAYQQKHHGSQHEDNHIQQQNDSPESLYQENKIEQQKCAPESLHQENDTEQQKGGPETLPEGNVMEQQKGPETDPEEEDEAGQLKGPEIDGEEEEDEIAEQQKVLVNLEKEDEVEKHSSSSEIQEFDAEPQAVEEQEEEEGHVMQQKAHEIVELERDIANYKDDAEQQHHINPGRTPQRTNANDDAEQQQNISPTESTQGRAKEKDDAEQKQNINPEDTDPPAKGKADQKKIDREVAKTVSDYMLYLLIMQPKIMTPVAGIGRFRFRDTWAEAKLFCKDLVKEKNGKKKRVNSACSELMKVRPDIPQKEAKSDKSKSVLFEGCRLANELNNLGDDKWMVIHKVWVEMLCYAATRCSGNAHAAQLSKGGQLITFVWLLMVHLGLGKQFLINEGNVRAKLVIGR